ncbi:MAG: hypothetical protein OXF02_04415 [Simkaniaceae bacterium]|nr:hypothetical protein [Simkaniaceae bacterium]
MSCFGCSESARSGFPPEVVGGRETKCAFLGKDVSEKVTDVVGDSFGPDKKIRIFPVAVPVKGRTTAISGLVAVSDKVNRKLPARIVTPSLPPEDGSEHIPSRDGFLAESERGKLSAEGPASTNPETKDVGVGAGTSAMGRSPAPVFVAPSPFDVLLMFAGLDGSMSASLDLSKGQPVVRLPPECGGIPDEVVRAEGPEDEVVNEGDRIDALIEDVLGREEADTFKAAVIGLKSAIGETIRHNGSRC